MALGDIVEIDGRTVLVLGQELDGGHGCHDGVPRCADSCDRARGAVAQAGSPDDPGHVDHIGNNDLPDEWAATRHITVEHYMPACDVPQMLDPQHYWKATFDRVVGVTPLPAPPSLVANKVVSLFQPLRSFGRTTRAFEELPLERFAVGTQRQTGWSFAGGAVRVIRTQGHCRGHVVVICAMPSCCTWATKAMARAG